MTLEEELAWLATQELKDPFLKRLRDRAALQRTARRWLQVRLGRLRLSPSCPSRLLHTELLSLASEALPPLLDMAPLIRAPDGLQPS